MPSPRWRPGESGNVAGRKPGSRNRLSDEIISSFLRDWRKHGDKALEKVRRTQPGGLLKLAVILVPKEHKVEHTDTYTNLSTEQIEAYIAEIQERLDRRAAGRQAKVIDAEGVETTAVASTTPPVLEPPKRRSNRLMTEADTAIGPAGAQAEEAQGAIATARVQCGRAAGVETSAEAIGNSSASPCR